MQKYAEFQPTQFDCRGLGLPRRQDWLVLEGVVQTRDSGPLAESNFAVALESLGGEGRNVEVHRFNHWGPGWFEIILIRPGSPQVAIAEDIERSLADYPLLDDEDHNRRELEAYYESWDNWAAHSFRRSLCGMASVAEDLIEDCDDTRLREFFESLVPSGEYYVSESSGVTVNLVRPSRNQLAKFIRELRREKEQKDEQPSPGPPGES